MKKELETKQQTVSSVQHEIADLDSQYAYEKGAIQIVVRRRRSECVDITDYLVTVRLTCIVKPP